MHSVAFLVKYLHTMNLNVITQVVAAAGDLLNVGDVSHLMTFFSSKMSDW